MKEIDKRYEKVDKETTESFQRKRELLDREEENLKDNLKNEVTKIKEKMEIFLSQIYNMSKSCDKIIKGLKSFNKEENNIVKLLSYVSAINKTKKSMNKLMNQVIINKKISYNEKESIIKYEVYNPIGKFQSNDCSIILNNYEKKDEFLDLLYQWTGYGSMKLLYRATKDGSESVIFHKKCDNRGPTICLCQNEKGYIFGGYSSISWTSPNKGIYKSAKDCFLFSLTNNQGNIPKKYPNINNSQAVYHNKNYGPTFGNGYDLKIYSNFLNNYDSYANIGNSYEDKDYDGNSIFSGDINSGYFKLKELEVFKLDNKYN